MKQKSFEGVTTALITPFKKGEVDFESLKKLIKFQLEGGIQGFVVAGSTGEAATLSLDEKKRILEFVLSETAGAVPVIMGSGTFNTQETCELIRFFEKQGPDGFLIVTPYYNRPPQRGLVRHFTEVAHSTKRPIIIYNVPSRTACTIAPETVAEIASQNSNVVGIKEAAGQIQIFDQLIKKCAASFLLLSGDDLTFLEAMEHGGHGVISVISHVIPSWCVESAQKARKHIDVHAMTEKVNGLATVLFCESNPIPVKWALREMGVIESGELRLPLTDLAPEYEKPLKACLGEWGLL